MVRPPRGNPPMSDDVLGTLVNRAREKRGKKGEIRGKTAFSENGKVASVGWYGPKKGKQDPRGAIALRYLLDDRGRLMVRVHASFDTWLSVELNQDSEVDKLDELVRRCHEFAQYMKKGVDHPLP